MEKYKLEGRRQTTEHIKRRVESRKKNFPNYFKDGYVPWRLGKTKENNESIKKMSQRMLAIIKVHTAGYIEEYCPEHPNNIRGYVMQHRLVMERKLGRHLTRWEQIHHINGVKNDNRPENLEIMTASEHARLHGTEKMRTQEANEKRIATCMAKYGKKANLTRDTALKAWATKRLRYGPTGINKP